MDRFLGEGGVGVVYAGFHLLLGQPIAIKCMKPSAGTLADQQRVTELFESCYEKHVPQPERFDSLILLTLMPTTQGAVVQVNCDDMVDGKRRPDDELSSCLSSKAAALTLPRPTGKIGLLRTGPVLVQLGTRRTQKKK